MTTEWVASSVADIIGEANYHDQIWLKRRKDLREQAELYGWEPYPATAFVNLLYVAMSANRGKFIDVGCGIGTKVRIAEALGLEAYGIELFEPYVEEARSLGAQVQQFDIREEFDYSQYGIIYINHPFRDTHAQDVLEYRIQRQMAPGSVLITVNNIRTMPEDWEMLCRPLWSEPDKIRFDWVARKPGGNNG